MDQRWFQILRIIFYVIGAWFIISTAGRIHWLLALLFTALAVSNVAVIWMLREYPYQLAVACRRSFIRQYVGFVCSLTGEQRPLEKSDNTGEILLRTRQDFDIAAIRAKQIVRGHDRVLDTTLSRIHENQMLRKSRRAGRGTGPLASFFLVGNDGVGKRYLMRVVAKLLYRNAGVEVFDCDRLTAQDLTGTKDQAGHLLEIVRRQPHSLILFERIERASSDAAKVLAQLLTSGKLHQPGSRSTVSFQDTTIAFTTTACSSRLAPLVNEELRDGAWQQRAIELLGQEIRIDDQLLNGVTDICSFESPSDLVKAEVIALQMKKECIAHNIQLSHVDPEILAIQVLQIEDSTGFGLVPQRVNKLLRKPLVAAAPQRAEALALRINTGNKLAPLGSN